MNGVNWIICSLYFFIFFKMKIGIREEEEEESANGKKGK